jgi:hypothetical protein
LTPTDCPRFQTCSALICPLDPRWPTAYHRSGERVCHYLLVAAKDGADDRFADDAVYAACRTALPMVAARWPAIGKAVEKAGRTGFRSAPPRPPRKVIPAA